MKPINKGWHGLHNFKLVTVARRKTIRQAERIYWIKTNQHNVVIEAHPLKNVTFDGSGNLRGLIDTGAWRKEVCLSPGDWVLITGSKFGLYQRGGVLQ